jgi:penicillin-binding protein-related factor A (putative recombinase)
MIINLIVDKTSEFFDEHSINEFSKLKINIKITSLLGVEVKGVSELYFTNPETNDISGINSYWINASNFKLSEMPTISKLHQL